MLFFMLNQAILICLGNVQRDNLNDIDNIWAWLSESFDDDFEPNQLDNLFWAVFLYPFALKGNFKNKCFDRKSFKYIHS